MPERADELAEIPATLILVHRHPVDLGSPFLSRLMAGGRRVEILPLVVAALEDAPSARDLVNCIRARILSFDEAVDSFAKRMRSAGRQADEILKDGVAALSGYLRSLEDRNLCLAGIDKLVSALFMDFPFNATKSTTSAIESLLWHAFWAGSISDPLWDLVSQLASRRLTSPANIFSIR